MWMTSRDLSLHPAVVIALFGQRHDPRPTSLAQLDRHLLHDIGIEPGQARGPAPPSVKPTSTESPVPQRSDGTRIA